MNDDVQEIIELAKQDDDVKLESIKALEIYKKANLQTRSDIGQYTLIESKALYKGLEIATDTINRVSTERDHYKEMVGDESNQQHVRDAIAHKIAQQTKNEKNRTALSEIRKTIESAKAICKTPTVKQTVVASQKK